MLNNCLLIAAWKELARSLSGNILNSPGWLSTHFHRYDFKVELAGVWGNPLGVEEMFGIFILVVVTWFYKLVKILWIVLLTFVNFAVWKLYPNKADFLKKQTQTKYKKQTKKTQPNKKTQSSIGIWEYLFAVMLSVSMMFPPTTSPWQTLIDTEIKSKGFSSFPSSWAGVGGGLLRIVGR